MMISWYGDTFRLFAFPALWEGNSLVTGGCSTHTYTRPEVQNVFQLASYQIRKIAGCACAGNAGNVFLATNFKGNRWLAIPACITPRASCISGSLTRGAGENVPSIPAASATRSFTYLARGPWHNGIIFPAKSEASCVSDNLATYSTLPLLCCVQYRVM